jgi:transmembrane 9 superfamily protein 2/4
MQIYYVMAITLVLSICGIFSPVHRKGLYLTIYFLAAGCGTIAGWTAARYYRLFTGRQWFFMKLLTAFGYPGIVGYVFVSIDLIEF